MLVTDSTAAAALERISRCDTLVVDTETTGLDTWGGDRVCGVSVLAAGESFYFPIRHSGPNISRRRYEQLLEAMSGKTLRGFHLRFDLEMLGRDGFPLPARIEDAIIAALLLNENEPTFALKRSRRGVPGLAPKYLGEDAVKDDDALADLLASRGLGKGDISKLTGAEVAAYAEADVVLPNRLLDEVYLPALRRWECLGLFQEYCDYQRLLIDMETRGVLIDLDVVEAALADGERTRETLLREIHAAAGYPLNPNSPGQVSAACGIPNAQAETLMRSGHPLAKKIVEYKVLTKRDSAYLQRFKEYTDYANRLHVQLNLSSDERDLGGTRSGRLSCSRPNLQAMPKPSTDPAYAPCRQALIAAPGCSLIEADYSQAEVRIAGHYSKDPALLRAFRENRDLYEEAATALGISRHESKVLFLAIQYGAGAWKISEMLGMDRLDASSLRKQWHKRFPGIHKAMYAVSDLAERNHAIRLFDGRWAHFDGAKKGDGGKSPYYTAWNRLIQGTVAGMLRQAMQRMWEPLTQIGSSMLLQVHDSVLFHSPTDRVDETIKIIKTCMEDFPRWEIPPVVTTKVGTTWLNLSTTNQ